VRSGDFDFIHFEDGRLEIVIGDVTGKVSRLPGRGDDYQHPARDRAESLVRFAVGEQPAGAGYPRRCSSPACMQSRPTTGKLRYTDAGHNLPYCRSAEGL
jgi:hypothetical protein